MLQVTQTEDSGYTVYKFEANNTEYEVLKDDSPYYQVYSKRKSLSRFSAPKLYTLEEMAARSKVLNNLSKLIAA